MNIVNKNTPIVSSPVNEAKIVSSNKIQYKRISFLGKRKTQKQIIAESICVTGMTILWYGMIVILAHSS